jgi:hypothetical protein
MARNDSAYPQLVNKTDETGEVVEVTTEGGLTKRELMAAMAMQGILANNLDNPSMVANDSVRCADALLEELGKTGKVQ